MKKKLFKLISIVFIIFVFNTQFVFAAEWVCTGGIGNQSGFTSLDSCNAHCGSRGGTCSEKKDTTSSGNTVSIPNPLNENGDELDLNAMIGTALNAVMGLIGSLALLMFVYGGFTWMTAAGSSEKIQKGKDILIWATIGIFVIFASYGLVSFILKAISGT